MRIRYQDPFTLIGVYSHIIMCGSMYIRRYHSDGNPTRISWSNGGVCNHLYIQLSMWMDGVRYVLRRSRNNLPEQPAADCEHNPGGECVLCQVLALGESQGDGARAEILSSRGAFSLVGAGLVVIRLRWQQPPEGGRQPRSAWDSQFTMMLGGWRQENCTNWGIWWWEVLRITAVCPCVKLVSLRLWV